MKKILPAVFLFLSASMAFATVSKEDVQKLLAAGISQDTIVQYIRRNGPATPLTPEDLTELKNAGASDKVLNALLDSSQSTGSSDSSGSTPAPATTTYNYYPSEGYYDSPDYYSYPYYYPYYPYYGYPYYYGAYPFFSFSFSNSHFHDDFHHHHDDFHDHNHIHTMPPPSHGSPHGGVSTFRGGHGGHH